MELVQTAGGTLDAQTVHLYMSARAPRFSRLIKRIINARINAAVSLGCDRTHARFKSKGEPRNVRTPNGGLQTRQQELINMLRIFSMVAISFCLTTVARAAVVDNEREALGVLAAGYARHREAFPAIYCRFDVSEGNASTTDEALASRFTSKRVAQHGRWLVREKNIFYELKCEIDRAAETDRLLREDVERSKRVQRAIDGSVESGGVSVPCTGSVYLRDAELSLHYAPVLNGANLFSKGDLDGFSIRVTPFNLDFLGPDENANPARYLKDALAGRFEAKFEGTRSIAGSDVLLVRVGVGLQATFGFDPGRGYMLVYASFLSGRSAMRAFEVYVTAAKKCAGDRWFPTRTILVNSPDSSPPFKVRELQVTDLDVETPPSVRQFHIKLPAGVQVSNIGRPEWITLQKPQSIGLSDLSGLRERCAAHGREFREIRDRAKALAEGKVTGRWPWGSFLLIAANILVIIVVAVVVLDRRRQHPRSHV